MAAEKNHWIDGIVRDRGAYRRVPVRYDSEGGADGWTDRQLCNSENLEDALIDALDAGLTAEEIADIQLGAIS